MKTGDLAKSLRSFAALADADAGNQLQQLAQFFSGGKDETIAQRIKKSGVVSGYPPSLKRSLEIIRDGFDEAGAKKQAGAIVALLTVFSGDTNISVEDFVASLSAPPPKPSRPAAKKKAPPAEPDHTLARALADELQKHELDLDSFNSLIARLRRPKEVNTPTLHLTANQFLGNSKRYKGRKAPVDDIVKRQQQDVRDNALERALDRVAV
jgi:hypothetical protein